MNTDILLSLSNISLTLGDHSILSDVTFQVCSGTTHALLGENSAGKTMLAKLVSGEFTPADGSISYQNTPLSHKLLQDTLRKNVSLISLRQDLLDDFTIAENLYLNHLPKNPFPRFSVNYYRLFQDAQDFFEQYGFPLDPKKTVSSLSLVERQYLSIAIAIKHNAQILILDEPYIDINEAELGIFANFLKKLTSLNFSIILITHEYRFAFSVSSDITILRNGKTILENQPIANTARKEIMNSIAGPITRVQFPYLFANRRKKILQLDGIRTENIEHPTSMYLLNGEILGLAGLSGSGRTALARAIYGLDPLIQGDMKLNGSPLTHHSPVKSVKKRIGLICNNIHLEQLLPDQTIADNISVGNTKSISCCGMISNNRKENLTLKYMKYLNIISPNINGPVSNLSSGMQQKVLLSRWIEQETNILILIDVTHNLDSATRIEIYNFMSNYILKGNSIIFISSNLDELMGMSSRILTLHHGKIVKELHRPEFEKLKILYYTSGAIK